MEQTKTNPGQKPPPDPGQKPPPDPDPPPDPKVSGRVQKLKADFSTKPPTYTAQLGWGYRDPASVVTEDPGAHQMFELALHTNRPVEVTYHLEDPDNKKSRKMATCVCIGGRPPEQTTADKTLDGGGASGLTSGSAASSRRLAASKGKLHPQMWSGRYRLYASSDQVNWTTEPVAEAWVSDEEGLSRVEYWIFFPGYETTYEPGEYHVSMAFRFDWSYDDPGGIWNNDMAVWNAFQDFKSVTDHEGWVRAPCTQNGPQ